MKKSKIDWKQNLKLAERFITRNLPKQPLDGKQGITDNANAAKRVFGLPTRFWKRLTLRQYKYALLSDIRKGRIDDLFFAGIVAGLYLTLGETRKTNLARLEK